LGKGEISNEYNCLKPVWHCHTNVAIMNLTRCILLGASLWAVGLQSKAGDWPQWRGPERTGYAGSREQGPGSVSGEPKVFWRKEIGGGFSSPVVAGGKLAYLDAQDGKEIAHLIDATTGKEIWQAVYGEMYEDEWGPGPRSTPIFDGDRVYVQSCKGEFRCLNIENGKVVWGVSFEKDFGVPFLGSKANEGTASRRGNDGCGIIDGDRIFLPVGANGASLVCYDKRTGKIIWKSQSDEAAYSSLMMATLAGVKQVVYYSADALMGVESESGKLLWRVPLRTDAKRHAATPVIFDDCIVVNSQTIGLMCIRIGKDGDGLKATQSWVNKQLKINISTPVLVNRFLYSQGVGRNLVCVDASDGKLMWSQEGFGEKYSAIIVLGKNLLVTTDRGELVMVAADSLKYSELGRMQICGKTWNHPAYADGKLYVREGLTSGWKLSSLGLMKSVE
jgi:outer membrane protein assembly factor BamB